MLFDQIRLLRQSAWGLLGLVIICSGCASTKMHSFVDPDFRDHSYERLMVAVQIENLDQRDDAETIFTEELAGTGVRCQRSLDVLPPTRQYDDDEFGTALADAGIDGLLIVRMTEYYEDEYYVPPSSTTSTTGSLSANTYYYGNTANTSGTLNATSYTTTTGGHTYTKPRVRHEVQLWDVQSGRMAWIGCTFTRGNAYARFKHLMSSLADEIKETLQEECLISYVHEQ